MERYQIICRYRKYPKFQQVVVEKWESKQAIRKAFKEAGYFGLKIKKL